MSVTIFPEACRFTNAVSSCFLYLDGIIGTAHTMYTPNVHRPARTVINKVKDIEFVARYPSLLPYRTLVNGELLFIRIFSALCRNPYRCVSFWGCFCRSLRSAMYRRFLPFRRFLQQALKVMLCRLKPPPHRCPPPCSHRLCS